MFDFAANVQKFEKLLGLNWAQSENSSRYCVPQADVSEEATSFMARATVNWGYYFKGGTSDDLQTSVCVIDPVHDLKNPGTYLSMTGRAFTMAYEHVKAGQHDIKDAATALALQGFMQGVYHLGDTYRELGHWSLGLDANGFNVYKLSHSENEKAFLQAAGDLIQRQSCKSGNAIQQDFTMTGEEQQGRLNLGICNQNIGDIVTSLDNELTFMFLDATEGDLEAMQNTYQSAIKTLKL